MSLYYARLARSDKPVRARRVAIVTLVVSIVTVAAVVVLLPLSLAHPNRPGYPAWVVATILAVGYLAIAAVIVLQVALLCLPRWQREKALVAGSGGPVFSVYLVPELESLILARGGAPRRLFEESATFVVKDGTAQLWSGAARPTLELELPLPAAARWVTEPDGFGHPRLDVDGRSIDLYLAGKWLGLNRRCGRALLGMLTHEEPGGSATA